MKHTPLKLKQKQKSSMSVTGKRVVVIGAGMAGLSFAIALEQLSKENNVLIESVQILERDAKVDSKDFQNYSLSIRRDSGGVQALEKIGALEEAVGFQSESTNWLWAGPPMKPEISGFRPVRVGLWKTLVGLLPESTTISWSKQAVKVVQDVNSPESPLEVHLDDGSVIEADLVVVADGNQSEVRKSMLPQENPDFTGLVLICGSSPREPPTKSLKRHGLIVGRDGVSMFLGHEAPGKSIWAVASVYPEPHTPLRVRTATDEQREEVLREAVLKICTWPEEIRQIVQDSDFESIRVVNGFDKLPHASVGRVVFIGDSNHPVTPYSANGANMALVDGVSLAEKLTCASYETVEAALKAFDQEMIPRATKIVNQGRFVISMAHEQRWWKCTMRDMTLRGLGLALNHPTMAKTVALSVVVGGLLGLGWWWKKRT